MGVVQSNAVRQAAACAAAAGLGCHVVSITGRVEAPGPEYFDTGNALLTRLFGAVIHTAGSDEERDEVAARVAGDLRAAGRTPFVFPYGISSVTGALGYVAASEEIAQQAAALPPFDVLVHASGSAGTQAGLAVGCARHLPGTAIVGVDVDAAADRVRAEVAALAAAVAERIGDPFPDAASIEVLAGHAGAAYGSAPGATLEAISLFARTEGLLLDPVYTGTAAAGLIAMVRSGRLTAGDRVLFVHTGGSPALHAYRRPIAAHLGEGTP